MRRFGRALLFGFIWFLMFWLGSLIAVGGVVGVNAGIEAETPQEAAALGREAGEEFGRACGPYVILGAAALAIIGSATGILPWTKPKKRPVAPRARYQSQPQVPYQYPPQAPPYQYPPQAPYHYPPPQQPEHHGPPPPQV